ncbi:hypothetical protein F5X99DRAFT_430263 [Biscogniauxia marginata]|nr:hypothetical protein F5X99DRAFT_430263 [Biscogniauxia marginata]
MKSDYYLTLCLEQAEQSPLHYRHGCIVVKGGKVIGKGFNDYRPGYDGGALKTGLLPTRSLAVDKQPHHKRHIMTKGGKPGQKQGFKPFENTVGILAGGHHQAQNSLSMHSEMMAINSALASSSTLAATTVSHIKPLLTPSHDSKFKRQQRGKMLNEYAQRVCYDAVGPQKQQQKQQQKHINYNEKHNKYNKKYKTPKRAQVQTINLTNVSSKKETHNSILPPRKKANHVRTSHAKIDKDMHPANGRNCESPTASNYGFRDRIKHPKLRGADIYVARLGGVQETRKKAEAKSLVISTTQAHDQQLPSSLPPNTTRSMAGSLHDELTCREARVPLLNPPSDSNSIILDRHNVLESRPCYRCVLYMHSAGIRRVYWTNSEGDWATAKVRDLFNQLSGTGPSSGSNPDFSKVFVTKHEILVTNLPVCS